MVALPPSQAAAATALDLGAPQVPPPAPPQTAHTTRPLSAASFAPGHMRPDGYISFAVWVGDQQHAVWAHR
eukprot:5251375-Alexandrium_andersonii.AAC.1